MSATVESPLQSMRAASSSHMNRLCAYRARSLPGTPRRFVPKAETFWARAPRCSPRRYLRKVLSAISMGNLRLSKEYAEERMTI
jgi:hypothetical protein